MKHVVFIAVDAALGNTQTEYLTYSSSTHSSSVKYKV
jgi:hypothetical protein